MSKVFKYQGYHLLGYVLLGTVLYVATIQFPDGNRRIWGMSTSGWIFFSWGFAGLFQGWIWFFWRMEFYLGKISAWMGKAGFLIFRIGFVVFGTARFLPVIPVSQSTAHTLALPRSVSVAIIVATTPFILWAIYSVFFYFGLNRTFGADHFDPAYRGKTMETRGIFKYIPNSMYTVAFLVLYHPGLFWRSRLGLIMILVHHAFLWCHYFCSEKPDLKEIYGTNDR